MGLFKDFAGLRGTLKDFSLQDSTGTSEDYVGLLKDFAGLLQDFEGLLTQGLCQDFVELSKDFAGLRGTFKDFSLQDSTGTSEDVVERLPQLNVTSKWLNIP